MVNISTLKMRDDTTQGYTTPPPPSFLTFKCLLLDFLPLVLVQEREAGGLEPQVMHLAIQQCNADEEDPIGSKHVQH